MVYERIPVHDIFFDLKVVHCNGQLIISSKCSPYDLHPLPGFATTWEAKSFHPHSSNEDDEDDEDADEEPMVRRSTTLAEASGELAAIDGCLDYSSWFQLFQLVNCG